MSFTLFIATLRLLPLSSPDPLSSISPVYLLSTTPYGSFVSFRLCRLQLLRILTMAPTRRSNKRVNIIALIPPKDEHKNEEYVKHTRTVTDANGATESTQERVVKVGDESTPCQILDFLASFSDACQTMHWTTGPKLFTNF